jgi:hypothetical protein
VNFFLMFYNTVPCVTGLLCTSKWHHWLFPSFPYRGCSVGELARTSTLCLTTDGSSRKCRFGSDVEIPVWRYPVGGKTRVLYQSRRATFCYYCMGYLFCFILWYMWEYKSRAVEQTMYFVFSHVINLASNKLCLFVKWFLWV